MPVIEIDGRVCVGGEDRGSADGDGTFVGFMGTMADVTDRRRRPFSPDDQSVRLVLR